MSFENFRKSLRASNGVAGENSDLDGRNADDLVVDVPVGVELVAVGHSGLLRIRQHVYTYLCRASLIC